MVSVTSDLATARSLARNYIERLQETLGADDYVLCLSDSRSNYWRNKVLPSYKQHRSQGTPPQCLGEVKKFLEDEFQSKKVPTMEADDVLGIYATWDQWHPGDEKVICSGDKDLLSIYGLHHDFKQKGTFNVTVEEADLFHLTQTLTGDVCDGFKGLPGIGPKKAEKILATSDTALGRWEAILEAYELRGFTAEDALIQARVARICRASDWDFNKKEVILWNPPISPSNHSPMPLPSVNQSAPSATKN